VASDDNHGRHGNGSMFDKVRSQIRCGLKSGRPRQRHIIWPHLQTNFPSSDLDIASKVGNVSCLLARFMSRTAATVGLLVSLLVWRVKMISGLSRKTVHQRGVPTRLGPLAGLLRPRKHAWQSDQNVGVSKLVGSNLVSCVSPERQRLSQSGCALYT